MRTWTDETTGCKMCEPDCADEWLFDIWAIGCDYDGESTVDGLKKLVDSLEGDEKTGAKIVMKALEAPLFYIAENAGLEGAVIVNKVKELPVGQGFDAYNEIFVDMIKAGILDPAKVTRSALQNATSVASTLLTTESVVANIKEDAPAIPAGAPAGMGMM